MRAPPLVSLEEARQRLLDAVAPLERPEKTPLLQGPGRVLFAPLASNGDYPPFDRSALDGYALRAADLRGASRRTPVVLPVAQRVWAGGLPAGPLGAGEAARVMTGAMLPPGCDCVLRQEDTDEGEDEVQIYTPLSPGDNIIRRGEDVQKGEPLLARGQWLDAACAALIASQGLADVEVYKKLRVGVLSTGDELAGAGAPLPEGKIYDSNGPMLAARLAALGMEPKIGRCADDPEKLAAAIEALLLGSDALITSGGVSVGQKDHLPGVLRAMGLRQLFHGVDVRPGTPALGGVLWGKPVVALSGNPFAALAIFEALALPALQKLGGHRSYLPVHATGTLQSDFAKAGGVRRLVRGRMVGGEVFLPAAGHASGHLASLMGCNCLLDLPPSKEAPRKGQTVQVLLLAGVAQ